MKQHYDTVKRLREQAKKWVLPREKAKEILVQVLNLIDGLLHTSNDAERVRLVRKLKKMDPRGEGPFLFAVLSALANPSPQVRKAQEQRAKILEAVTRNLQQKYKSWAHILHKATGVDRPTCRAIVEARAHSRKFKPSWPIKSNVVVGPKGSMPLEGSASYWAVYEDRQEAKRKARLSRKGSGT